MKKLKDKTIILICSICMTLMCCFGLSYKMANKTYADLTPITDKQRLGAFLSSLAFSCGVKVYIATVSTYEWLVDNFNYVMLRLQFQMSANDVYQNALDNFDNENKTYTLDPEFTNAVQEYLKYLQSEGINEYSGQIEIGSYEEEIEGTYLEMEPNTTYHYVTSNGESRYIQVNVKARGGWLKNNGTNGFNVYGETTAIKTRTKTGNGNWSSWNGYYGTSTYKGKTVYCGFYTFGISNLTSTGDFPMTIDNSLSNLQINDHNTQYWCKYLYGDVAISNSTQTISVGGEPNRYWSETEITLDRDAEYTVDYSETDGADETNTLDELVQLINQLIDTGTEEQQETIPQVDVQILTPTIDPTTVDIPSLFDGIPQIVSPDCVGLGSCMISGVQTVSEHLQNIYSSNSNVANYTMVSLAIGIALFILTGGL